VIEGIQLSKKTEDLVEHGGVKEFQPKYQMKIDFFF
jgi:hypothetical protein